MYLQTVGYFRPLCLALSGVATITHSQRLQIFRIFGPGSFEAQNRLSKIHQLAHNRLCVRMSGLPVVFSCIPKHHIQTVVPTFTLTFNFGR